MRHHPITIPDTASSRLPAGSKDDAYADEKKLYVFTKNARSLKADDRIEELIRELAGVQWDVVLICETWRVEQSELWETRQGHLFVGAGWGENSRGVAILFRNSWKHSIKNVIYVNERVLAVDADLLGERFRFIAVYMPHGGYSDAKAQEVYATLLQLKTEAARRGRKS